MAVHVFISSYDARAGVLTIRKHIVFIAWKVSICAENVLAGMLEPLFSGRLYATLLSTNKVRYSITTLNHSLYYFFLGTWLLLAEGIYIALEKPSNLITLGIPIVVYSLLVFLVASFIDSKTRRKTQTVMAHISQWDLQIMSDQSEQGQQSKKVSLHKKLIIAKNVLGIILLLIWIAISATILIFFITR